LRVYEKESYISIDLLEDVIYWCLRIYIYIELNYFLHSSKDRDLTLNFIGSNSFVIYKLLMLT
jgi:hypothetical protein